ncbi:tRNA (adenosine(37)-N6)-threonylcarbamoyltransferase complex ATPase subunit type 1 TsaE [Sphingoaurantiacus capsulatus]|uniref:tRNA threonylcarbamoyladenosine biosynthesis protein TsaE n=1 Tax=Sphingoaurantiacus capsulatus TaxID=1771310 RepID=A0ABV7X5Y7_9SPHN
MVTFASPEALEAFGARLAAVARTGDVIALYGDLGAGKTTLARGLLRGLGLEGEAPSPTFTLVQTYDPPEMRLPVWHCDLYRLDDPEEAVELGLEEAFGDALVLIEWPERLGRYLPADALRLYLDGAGEAQRRLTAEVPPGWEARWPS